MFHLSESDIINSPKNEYNLVRIANADRIAQYIQSIGFITLAICGGFISKYPRLDVPLVRKFKCVLADVNKDIPIDFRGVNAFLMNMIISCGENI